MYNITFDKPAEDMLDWLKSRDNKMHGRIVIALDELEKQGICHPQIHKIISENPIYRRRVGRWRIVFTTEPGDELAVWIIDMEKDTGKDYRSWITRIKQRRKIVYGV